MVMHQKVSVDEAIKKGIYTVNLPALLIFIIGLIASFAMAFLFFKPYAMIPGLVFSYILATVYRTLMAAKWRIWAFDSVRNVRELRERALSEKLMYLNNRPGFGIINYNSESQKQRWEQLQVRFQQPDVFVDDKLVPVETVIRYSLPKTLIWTVFFLLVSVFAIYLFTLGLVASYIFGTVLIILGVANTYIKLKYAFNREARIVINNNGISTANTPFYEWTEVHNEKVIREGSGKYAIYYLCYDHPKGSAKFRLYDLNISFMLLQKLLRVYRGRSAQAA
jgi:hypothetical protein